MQADPLWRQQTGLARLRHVGCKAYARGAAGVFGGQLSL
jgi:hypothetical protein